MIVVHSCFVPTPSPVSVPVPPTGLAHHRRPKGASTSPSGSIPVFTTVTILTLHSRLPPSLPSPQLLFRHKKVIKTQLLCVGWPACSFPFLFQSFWSLIPPHLLPTVGRSLLTRRHCSHAFTGVPFSSPSQTAGHQLPFLNQYLTFRGQLFFSVPSCSSFSPILC